MGQAKQRRAAEAAQAQIMPSAEEFVLIARAMHQVIGAITSAYGADCLMYAGVGAKVLSALGLPAKMVAGSAGWRIGPGDGDSISHALELQGHMSTVGIPEGAKAAGMFHAWVECGDTIIDFTTSSLREKARYLDQMDGGSTAVEWCPEVLVASRRELTSLVDVVQGEKIGAFGYVQHPRIENVVFRDHAAKMDFDAPAAAVLLAYRSLKAGNELQVFGVGPQDEPFQTLETARSADRKFKPL